MNVDPLNAGREERASDCRYYVAKVVIIAILVGIIVAINALVTG